MVVSLLPLAWLVAIETGDVSAAVLAALELVDDGGRLLAMTLGAAPGRRYELRKRLINLGRGSGVVYSRAPSSRALLMVMATNIDLKGIRTRPE